MITTHAPPPGGTAQAASPDGPPPALASSAENERPSQQPQRYPPSEGYPPSHGYPPSQQVPTKTQGLTNPHLRVGALQVPDVTGGFTRRCGKRDPVDKSPCMNPYGHAGRHAWEPT